MNQSKTLKPKVIGEKYNRDGFEVQARYTRLSGNWSVTARSAKTIEEARKQRDFNTESQKAMNEFLGSNGPIEYRIVKVKTECEVVE